MLPRSEVTVRQFLYAWVVQLRRWVDGCGRRPIPSAVEKAVDRRRGGGQYLCHLQRREAQDIMEQQSGALAGRQLMERGNKSEAYRFPGYQRFLWVDA